jgi:hypothetical protein
VTADIIFGRFGAFSQPREVSRPRQAAAAPRRHPRTRYLVCTHCRSETFTVIAETSELEPILCCAECGNRLGRIEYVG